MMDHKPKLDTVPPTCFNDLPNSLLEEILLRLPLIDAHRSKLVCNRWYSVISEPYFAHRFSKGEELSFLFLVYLQSNKSSYVYLSDSYHYHLNANMSLDFLNSDTRLRVEASSNDLLLCSSGCDPYYLVCNPVTREISARLPSLPKPWFLRLGIFTGFASKKDGEFAVIMIDIYATLENPELFVWALSSNALAWFKIPCHPRIQSFGLWPHSYFRVAAIPHKGMLFWYSRDAIFGIDPFNVSAENPWLFIELPEGFIQRNNVIFTCELGECRKNLRLCQLFQETSNSDLVLRVWDLKDPSEWTLHRHMSLHKFVKLYDLNPRILVGACHPNDPEIIYLLVAPDFFRIEETIFSLNMSTSELIKIENLCESPNKTDHWMQFLGVTPYTIQWHPTPI